MFEQAERDFVKITIAVIGAVTFANAIVNSGGTVAIAKVILGFPVDLAKALKR